MSTMKKKRQKLLTEQETPEPSGKTQGEIVILECEHGHTFATAKSKAELLKAYPYEKEYKFYQLRRKSSRQRTLELMEEDKHNNTFAGVEI